MALMEKWKEYKQRKEAQRYFRGNNDAFLDVGGYIKLILICLGISLIGEFINSMIILKLDVNFGIIYLIIGYCISKGIYAVTSAPRMNVIAIAILCYIFGLICLYIFEISYFFGFQVFFIPSMYVMGVEYIFSQGIIAIVMEFLGAFEIYYLTK